MFKLHVSQGVLGGEWGIVREGCIIYVGRPKKKKVPKRKKDT